MTTKQKHIKPEFTVLSLSTGRMLAASNFEKTSIETIIAEEPAF